MLPTRLTSKVKPTMSKMRIHVRGNELVGLFPSFPLACLGTIHIQSVLLANIGFQDINLVRVRLPYSTVHEVLKSYSAEYGMLLLQSPWEPVGVGCSAVQYNPQILVGVIYQKEISESR